MTSVTCDRNSFRVDSLSLGFLSPLVLQQPARRRLMQRWPTCLRRAPLIRHVHSGARSHSAQPTPATRVQTHQLPPNPPSTKPRSPVDPYSFLAPELTHIRCTLLHLLGSSHPGLTQIAKYYFLHPSKQLRPLLVLLFASACNGLGRDWRIKRWQAECEGAGGRAQELDMPLSRADVLNDWNPNMPDHTASFEMAFTLRPPRRPTPPPIPEPLYVEDLTPSLVGTILPTQRRLAQIVEMIHVASLLHDDVLDDSPLRRSAPSAPAKYGNKLSVLAGDFLLGRASASLSRLGDSEVVELIASVITNLVEGEILQIKEIVAGVVPETTQASSNGHSRSVRQEDWNIYLKKSYLKTASLMAKGARAAVILGGAREGEVWKEVAYAYGRNIGIAFQVCLVVSHIIMASHCLFSPVGRRSPRLRGGRSDARQTRRSRSEVGSDNGSGFIRMGGA